MKGDDEGLVPVICENALLLSLCKTSLVLGQMLISMQNMGLQMKK